MRRGDPGPLVRCTKTQHPHKEMQHESVNCLFIRNTPNPWIKSARCVNFFWGVGVQWRSPNNPTGADPGYLFRSRTPKSQNWTIGHQRRNKLSETFAENSLNKTLLGEGSGGVGCPIVHPSLNLSSASTTRNVQGLLVDRSYGLHSGFCFSSVQNIWSWTGCLFQKFSFRR